MIEGRKRVEEGIKVVVKYKKVQEKVLIAFLLFLVCFLFFFSAFKKIKNIF